MVLTPLGMLTETKLSQLLKADLLPNSVTVDGITTLRRLSHPEKAYSPIITTV